MQAEWMDSVTEPLPLFRSWMALAEQGEPNDPNAVALATSTPTGIPSVRMVLLKSLDERGFGFYTNAEGRKGRELEQNPHAAMCFHWKSLRRQVRVEGTVTELPTEEADRYFHSRSRRSQLGAAASEQSRPLQHRAILEDRVKALAEQFPGEIPRPPNWRGYVLNPSSVEFWMDGPDRLHDRLLLVRNPQGWTRSLLYP